MAARTPMSSDMSGYSHSLSLRARHGTKDLSIIPTTLGMEAQRIWKRGEPRQAPAGTLLDGAYGASYCSIEFGVLTDLPQSIAAALTVLKPHSEFLQSLAEDGVQFAFFVGWFSEEQSSGGTLGVKLLQDLADLRISLELNFYAPDQVKP